MSEVHEGGKRFEFGRNWQRFVKRNFSEDRLAVSRQRLLEFVGVDDLAGHDFLDIGCGSGIHSYAAIRAGARRVHSFDYDENSVAAAKSLQSHAHRPANWTIEQGDVLDQDYLAKLGQWSFVYSWGVLHHTGDMWRAVRNAAQLVEPNGLFYIALYSADADFQPSKEFWLDVKKRFNRAGAMEKRFMVGWYIWRFSMQGSLRRLPSVINQIVSCRLKRGMNYFADIRDWLGGWPMEYAGDQDVVDLLEKELDFALINVKIGEACSEFLFKRSGSPETTTNVKQIVAQGAG